MFIPIFCNDSPIVFPGAIIPIIVRLQGTNADLAKKIIDSSGLDVQSAVEFEEAAQKVKEVLAS